ncbi:MAG: hypothetical protein M0R80_12410 [Proteobacteria bacterium]|jgi:hypothetical protein|nr:hypothetical protein [Pseudomonadota bacterium]
MVPQLDDQEIRTALRIFLDLAAAYCARGPDARDPAAEKVLGKVVPVLLKPRPGQETDHVNSLYRDLADEVAKLYGRFQKDDSFTHDDLRAALVFLLESHLPTDEFRNAKMSFLDAVSRSVISSEGGPHECAYGRVANLLGLGKRTLDNYRTRPCPMIPKPAFGSYLGQEDRLRFFFRVIGFSAEEVDAVFDALREVWQRRAEDYDDQYQDQD